MARSIFLHFFNRVALPCWHGKLNTWFLWLSWWKSCSNPCESANWFNKNLSPKRPTHCFCMITRGRIHQSNQKYAKFTYDRNRLAVSLHLSKTRFYCIFLHLPKCGASFNRHLHRLIGELSWHVAPVVSSNAPANCHTCCSAWGQLLEYQLYPSPHQDMLWKTAKIGCASKHRLHWS